MLDFNHKKAVQSLNFFAIQEGSQINKMKAIKLIWLSDRAHLRRYGRPIIMDQYFALPFGSVPSYTKDLAEINIYSSEDEVTYRNQYLSIIDKYHYKTIKAVEEKVFSTTDLSILKVVYAEFGHFSEFQLSELSHLYPEWKKHESGLLNKISSRYKMDYLDFFEDPANGNSEIFNESVELKELAKDLFLENTSIVYGCC